MNIDRALIDRLTDRSGCDAVVVSVSLGNADRDHEAIATFAGRKIRMIRIGVGGNTGVMSTLLRSLDGKVNAFGIGGADLGCLVDRRWYPFRTIESLVRHVRHTPVVDGSALKIVLEKNVIASLGDSFREVPLPRGRTAFLTTGCNRWGMLEALQTAGFKTVYGDFMFGLGLPVALKSAAAVRSLAALMLPAVGYFPFSWLYPTGEAQNRHQPKWTRCFERASVVAGDTHYITSSMPAQLDRKIIIVNTTTERDLADFRKAGAAVVITSTPNYEGRSFGTNVLEAALVAAAESRAPVDYRRPAAHIALLERVIDQAKLKPGMVYL